MRGLEVETRNGAGGLLLSVEGEVDLATAPALDAALERALLSQRASVIVDLREVNLVDASGLRLLLRRECNARAGGRRLIVVKGPPHVHRVFVLTGVSERLTMVDEPPDEAFSEHRAANPYRRSGSVRSLHPLERTTHRRKRAS
jgi:anti-sigma B factor antagonist